MSNTQINYLPYVLKFDGQSDRIILPELNINYSQGLTIEAWVYYNSFTSGASIIDFSNGAGKNNIVFANQGASDTLVLNINNQEIIAEKALETGKWLHLAATVDAAGNVKIYQNSQEIQSGKIQLPESINRTQNFIGNSHYSEDGYFNGRLSEVRLWKHARLPEELQRDMHRRLEGNETGLVGYWPLNEGSGYTASEEGKIQGATWYQQIFFPIASPLSYPQPVLSFHGQNDYIEIKDPFANNKEFTISLWVKPSFLNDEGWHGCIGKQGDQYRKPGLWLSPNQGLHYDSYDLNGKRYSDVLNNFFEVENEWIHITWVKQATEYRFYRNGELFITKTAPELFYTNQHTCYWIGRVDNFWWGEIAEVSIWNFPRTQEEIKAGRYQHLVDNEPGLVSYWPLNEGIGQTATDRTSRGNVGKIIGANWQQEYSIKAFEQKANFIEYGLDFDGVDDYIELFPESIPSGNEITVTFWAKGGSRLPKNATIIEAIAEDHQRVLSIQLPNVDGIVYFDCGCDISQATENFDRLEKAAQVYEYQDEWTHWAFVKNVTAGEMKIYRNGLLWHSGNEKTKALPTTRVANIGRLARSASAYYHGTLAEFAIWNQAKTLIEIQADIGKSLNGNEPNLVAYWPLQDSYGDLTANKVSEQNYGKIKGAKWHPKVVNNQALHLPSSLYFQRYDNHIEIKDPFENDKEFTISLWVKPTLIEDGNWQGIIGHEGDKYRKPGIWLTPEKSGLVYDSYDLTGKRYFAWINNFFEAKDEWINITWVKQGTEYRLYRDGELLLTQPAPEQFFHNKDTAYWIGKVDNFWSGAIAEVVVWNYARSATEIKSKIYNPLRGDELGLVGYWPLNEGSGDIVRDRSDVQGQAASRLRANHGKISFATWTQQNFIKPAAVNDEPNVIKSGLKFDGHDDHISLPRMDFDYTLGFTIEAWVYYNSFQKSSRIIDFGNGIDKDNIIFGNLEIDNDLILDIKRDGVGQQIIATNVLEPNRWMHLAAMVGADGTGKIYRNGEEVKSGKIHLPKNTNRTLNYIARSNYSFDGYFDGMISEVRFWNKIRTQEELQKNMHRRLLGNDQGLIGYWPFNEGCGNKVLDKTSNSNTGIINGAIWPQSYQSDYLQPILTFDGKGDYVEIPEHTNSSNQVTVSAWARSNTPIWNQYGCLVSKRNPFSLHPEAGGKTFHFYIRSGMWKCASFTPNIDITKWHHYAGTFDGRTIRLYIDGEEVARTEAPGQLNNDNGRLYIGRDVDSPSRYFNGQISEVQVWDKALTKAEIEDNLHRSLVGNEPGLIGYWPLNEGSGDKVLDRTHRALHGKRIGAAWDGQIFFVNEPLITRRGWQQVQKLQPTDLNSNSFFGEEAAISGEWAIVSARKANASRLPEAGAAYILQLQNKMWHLKQKLQPHDSRVSDQFGCDVDISGEWAIVGARKADTVGMQDTGAAYAFRLENRVWQQVQKLQPIDLAAHDYFGKGLVISGEWALIGAYNARANGNRGAGAVYVFRLENGIWQQIQKLQPKDLGVNQCFGNSIAISGEWAIIGGGDRYASANVKRPFGGAYIYRLENSVWQLKQKLQSTQVDGKDLFGYSVAIAGEHAFVGAVGTKIGNVLSAGSVYTYQLEKGVWQPKQKLQAEHPKYCGFFGATVAIAKDMAIVGSTRANSAKIIDTGDACVFHLEKGLWQQKQKLQPTDLHYENYFGFCTPIDGEWVFSTAAWANNSHFRRVGAIYIFQGR
ncbi:LamG-like jellyroll fold domain-containing protein [Nostoc sp. ChiQUE01b]|uniref:LamG-like jellyroll fold domain-containing protein n=1 Tax=Nostoc sp. ChiQUE01b TaxID=3075376 RepID=UPI002AD36166|nr:LamG-like jellyroll fold domain-containing protein [Nostoc sp. ChiQUE01b]MDZ8262872.1 LamG-like jellyroll fold domain-containing protein [Nostoc sp. ChiQUE01b]